MADQLHQVLAAVYKATKLAPTDVGTKPMLYNPTYVELALWIADQGAPHVPAGERKRYERLLALARPVRRPDDLSDSASTELDRLAADQLDDNNTVVAGAPPALALAIYAANEAVECDSNCSCGVATRRAAVIAAQLLGEPFVRALEREILRLDAVTLVRQQELAVAPAVAETLWRGATGLKATHWIVRLTDDSHALLAKQRGRWTAIPGAREDVLASVPDNLMASAVAAVMGGSAPAPAPAAPPHLDLALPAKVRALALSADGAQVYALAGKHTLAWRTRDGAPIAVPREAAPLLAQKPAKPPYDHKARTVDVGGRTLRVEKPGITCVVVAGGRTLVAYHGGKRLAIFDDHGALTHTLDARELGRTVQLLVPLTSGLVLGFGSLEALLLDASARVLAEYPLASPRSQLCFASAGDRVAFARCGRPRGNHVFVI